MMVCRAGGTTLVSAVTTEGENDHGAFATITQSIAPTVNIFHNQGDIFSCFTGKTGTFL
jgi:hypothetical protein